MENIESTRIYELEETLTISKECKKIDKELDILFDEIILYLPEGKKNIIPKIEDFFTEMLILYEEYFYKNGYLDNLEDLAAIGLFKRL